MPIRIRATYLYMLLALAMLLTIAAPAHASPATPQAGASARMDAVLLLDSSRLQVLPLAGRSFHYRPLAATGDFEKGQVLGEYTLELRNEAAHGIIRGLTVA